MQISSRFTLSVHILLCIDLFSDTKKVTGDFLAGSTNINPVVVRRLLGELKSAGLVLIARGTGGATLAKSADEITLYDIYLASRCVGDDGLFHFHENPNKSCPVGRSIHSALGGELERIQRVMESELRAVTLEMIKNNIKI